MTASKTVIDNSDINWQGNTDGGRSGSGMYRQSGGVSQATYVPSDPVDSRSSGFFKCPEDIIDQHDENAHDSRQDVSIGAITRVPRKIAGVMFSISRGSQGEIYPIYIGMNRIGRYESFEIVLREATVSMNHAEIRVMQNEESGMYEVLLSDRGSYYGSSVNGANARYETVRIDDGDIVKIGSHYKFLIRLFNCFGEQLEEDPDFEATLPEEMGFNEDLKTGVSLSDDFYTPSNKKKGSDETVVD